MKQIKTGLPLEDGVTQPADIQFAHGKNLGGGKGSWYIITVYEGRNRLVRRTFSHFGLKTVRLVRFGMGNVRLPDDLKPGEYRQMSSSMLTALKKDLQLIP
jgi:23S rRNA pseudouridine2605 synthase